MFAYPRSVNCKYPVMVFYVLFSCGCRQSVTDICSSHCAQPAPASQDGPTKRQHQDLIPPPPPPSTSASVVEVPASGVSLSAAAAVPPPVAVAAVSVELDESPLKRARSEENEVDAADLKLLDDNDDGE